MFFLINAFLAKLRDYSFIRFEYKWLSDECIQIDLFNIPPEVDVKLVRAKIEIVDGYRKKEITRGIKRGGNYFIKEPNIIEHNCCIAMDDNRGKYVRVILDKDTYAKKMNAIECILRQYLISKKDKGIG